jgi:hypothetical protein
MNRPNLECFEVIRGKLMALMVKCPLVGNPEDCLMHEKRDLPFMERHNWIESLSGDKILSLYSTHVDCLETRARALSRFITTEF